MVIKSLVGNAMCLPVVGTVIMLGLTCDAVRSFATNPEPASAAVPVHPLRPPSPPSKRARP